MKKKMAKKYKCYYVDEPTDYDVEDLFYLIKNYQLVEIVLDNGYYIRQWRDVPMTYDTENESYQMEYWTVYCTSWNNVLESVWTGWGEKELQEYIDICSEYI